MTVKNLKKKMKIQHYLMVIEKKGELEEKRVKQHKRTLVEF